MPDMNGARIFEVLRLWCGLRNFCACSKKGKWPVKMWPKDLVVEGECDIFPAAELTEIAYLRAVYGVIRDT